MIKRFFIALFLILVVMATGLGYYLSDKETLKEELSAQLSVASGYQVEISRRPELADIAKVGISCSQH